MHILRHFIRSQIHKILQQLLNQIVLAESIHQVHAGLSAADVDDPVNHIEILFHVQRTIQILHIPGQLPCEFFLSLQNKSPFPQMLFD